MGAWLRDAFSDAAIPDRVPRRLVIGLVLAAAALFFTLAWLRFATYHNRTFDLAFYARMAWGLVRFDMWNPIVNAWVYGLHLSWILFPLGAVGAIVGQVPALLAAQSLALAAAAFPLARIGARHLGPPGAPLAALAWLLHPNVAHVAANEFHPGSVAALPLAFCAEAIDRRSAPGLALGALGVLACREDLGAITLLAGLAACVIGVRAEPRRRDLLCTGAVVAIASLAYVAFFALVLLPTYQPRVSSLELHFGRLGTTPLEVVRNALAHPLELARHLATPPRLLYLPLILAPLGLLPLLRPAHLLLGTPVLAMNLLSEFPGTTDLDSHYLTPALPFAVASAVHGAAALPSSFLRVAPLAGSTLVAHLLAGGTPLALSFPAYEYRDDAASVAARRVVEQIGPDASVQAPDRLLPHLAERPVLHRTPPPEARTRFVVLDAWHRRRYQGNEDLLRTTEEPLVRTWLARDDHALVLAIGDYLVLERGREPREGVGADAIVGRGDPNSGVRLCDCLALAGAHLEPEGPDVRLTLELIARDRCPEDLALRIGRGKRPQRVDLIAGGLLSPVHFRAGDRVRSVHLLARHEFDPRDLRVGALRSSGARPHPEDPMSVPVNAAFP
jgi:uncharacterized membrane protein